MKKNKCGKSKSRQLHAEVHPSFYNEVTEDNYQEFYDYLKRKKIMKQLEMFLFRLLTENCTDEEYAIRVLRQCFGGVSTKNDDTTKITGLTEESKRRTADLKAELNTWMARFLDAVERSTNHLLFVDENLRGRSRAEALLKTFSIPVKLSSLKSARMDVGLTEPRETVATQARQLREELAGQLLQAPQLLQPELVQPEQSSAKVVEYNLALLEEEASLTPESESCSQDDNIV